MDTTDRNLQSDSVITRICHMGFLLLGDRSNCLIRQNDQALINGESCSYSLSISRISDDTLVLDEQVLALKGSRMTHRHWVFENREGWILVNAGKNGIPVDPELNYLELVDLMERLEDIQKGKSSRFDIPVTHQGTRPNEISGKLQAMSGRVFTLAAAGLVMAGLFLTIFISTMQYGRMLKTVLTLNETISTTSRSNNESINILSSELSRINEELYGLKEEVFQEQEAFEFNKKQTAMNLRWLASRFPRSYSSRAHAYKYLADRIEESSTYGEMVFQLSRLPENNAQAETLMATDRSNKFSMENYEPVFPGLKMPVDTGLPGSNPDVFMITSGYIERRLSPLGYGGVKPHLAVDLINLDNIIRITDQNEIIRDESRPGIVQSVYDGTVMDAGFDWVFGWHVELNHAPNSEILSRYPQARFWTSFYAHLEDLEGIEPGDQLDVGEKIGNIGNSGKSTGPHLHYEIRIYHPRGRESNRFGSFDRVNPYVRRVHSIKE